MRKRTCLVILGLLIFNYCGSSGKGYPRSQRYLTAVLTIENRTKNEIVSSLSEALRSELISALHQGGRVRLIERDRVNAILKEHAFNQTGAVDASKAMQAGKLLGAEAIVLASIDAFKAEQGESNAAGIAVIKSLTIRVKISARMIHSETGEILAAATAAGEGVTKEHRAGPAITGKIDAPESLRLASEDAIQTLTEKLSENIPPRS